MFGYSPGLVALREGANAVSRCKTKYWLMHWRGSVDDAKGFGRYAVMWVPTRYHAAPHDASVMYRPTKEPCVMLNN